jgi:DNA-binding Lrp family transcriptional regulator
MAGHHTVGKTRLRPVVFRQDMERQALDRTDFALLRLLQQDAWLPIKELAATVGLAASSVHERIKRLQAAGVLRGAVADIGLEQLGLNVQALVMVTLKEHDRDAVRTLLREISALPSVQSAYFLSGSVDLVVHVACGDVGALKSTLDDLAARSEVRRLETSLILDATHPGNIASEPVTPR